MPFEIEAFGANAALLFVLVLLFLILVMAAILWVGWWMTNRSGAKSPYTGLEMKRGEDLAFSAVHSIQKYLDGLSDPLNPEIEIRHAAICHQTGRVFSNAVNGFGVIRLDWDFLEKRARGNWISWGALSEQQREEILFCHDSLQGYQTEDSCKEPNPEKVDLYHATLSPGPLYVDCTSRHILGWKKVPDTGLEVLVLQRPWRKPNERKQEDIEDTIS